MFLDLLGAILSLLATYYFIRINSKAWGISLLAIMMNGWLYWQKGIYADTVLESFYFLSTCYGWYLWRRVLVQNTAPSIIHISLRQCGIVLSLGLIIFVFVAWLLTAFTDSNVVFLDALTTSISLLAQALMCYKMILTWLLWLVTDALYVYMYLHKKLPFHSLLMLIYTGMAIVGYRNWRRKLRGNSLADLSKSKLTCPSKIKVHLHY
jgi:nicotinamide mononucleotide transporter